MKLLFIHANYMNYQVKEKAKSAEELPPQRKAGGMRDPLIIFVCSEKRDEIDEEVIGLTMKEIKDVASKVKAKNLVLFPFAHLSSSLSSPEFAVQVLKCLECKLAEEGFRVMRVPFGWYKAFEFKSKGHPLSVLSRSIPKEGVS
ncbi:MAG: threonyl-tRNA synthetase editing domain-containing protein [Candidatus Hadarchaeales archaeon]